MSSACPKELVRQSEASPGTVQCREQIVYVLLDPDHWKDGNLTKSAFSRTKLEDCTLSVCRSDHCKPEDVRRHVIEPLIAKNSSRRFVGAFCAPCAAVRRIHTKIPETRAFCVVDDGLSHYPAHAVLGFSEATKTAGFWERNDRIAARANLIHAFDGNSTPLSLADCFKQETLKENET